MKEAQLLQAVTAICFVQERVLITGEVIYERPPANITWKLVPQMEILLLVDDYIQTKDNKRVRSSRYENILISLELYRLVLPP